MGATRKRSTGTEPSWIASKGVTGRESAGRTPVGEDVRVSVNEALGI